MSFNDLGLSAKVLAAVEASGYTEPTPIQEQAIPHVLQRRDVLGIAQTGTGKTAGFTLPMITLLEKGRARARMPRTLILEPTRELAAQVAENFEKYGQNHKLSVALLIGGVSFDEQIKKLDRGADVLIATPGRLLDLFERGRLLMQGVEILVIDEADRMLDMGFIPDIERIAKMIPFTRQTLFFSATMPPVIEKLADKFLQNPVQVAVAAAASASKTITQRLVKVSSVDYEKRSALRDLIDNAKDLKNAIVFCNRKRDVADLFKSLKRHEYSVGALHGDMDQRSRSEMLAGFRDNKISIMVASDVAARGLDIPDVSHVFNFDVPTHAEDYVHRIGRTGRAGREGAAFTLVAPGELGYMQDIEKLIDETIEWKDEALTTEEDSQGRRGKRGKRRSSPSAKSPSKSTNPKKEGGAKKASDKRSNDATSDAPVEPSQEAKAQPQHPKPSRAKPGKSSKPRQKELEAADTGDGKAFGSEDQIPAFMRR